MKDILNDLKIMLTNNYTFTVLCLVLAGGVNFLPDLGILIVCFAMPVLVYTLIHNITKVAFNHPLSLPDRNTAGWRLIKKISKSFVIIFLGILVIMLVVYHLAGDTNSGGDGGVDYVSIITNALFSLLISYFYVKDLSILVVGLFPDTKELSWSEDLAIISEGIPNHVYYFVVPLAGIYYIDLFLGWTCISFVCTAYTLRYVIGTPPQPKQKVKVMEVCEDM